MAFLEREELMEMDDLLRLALYRSLLEQIYALDSFGTSQVATKLGEVRDIIENKIMNPKEEYFINGSKYVSKGLTIKNDNSFKLFGVLTQRLTDAGERLQEEAKNDDIARQTKDNNDLWKEIYISHEYPADLIVKEFGQDTIIEMLGEELTLKWLDKEIGKNNVKQGLEAKPRTVSKERGMDR